MSKRWKDTVKAHAAAASVLLPAALPDVSSSNILAALNNAFPSIVMAAATLPMFAADNPDAVKIGGASLVAIAMIVADLQNDKKLGYTDKIMGAMRKIPGLKNADESTVIGLLGLCAGTSLGMGPAETMVHQHHLDATDLSNNAANFVSYRAGDLMGIPKVGKQIEKAIGKELSFNHREEDGTLGKTAPISTTALMQQILYVMGGAGVTGFGAGLPNPGVVYTGLMLASSNGIAIGRMVGQSHSDEARAFAKIRSLGEQLERSHKDQDGHTAELRDELYDAVKEWKKRYEKFPLPEPTPIVRTIDREPVEKPSQWTVSSQWSPTGGRG